MPQYRFIIDTNNDSSTFSTPYSFGIYNEITSPVLTATMIPQVIRFLNKVSLSSTAVSSVSSVLDTLGA